VEHQTPVDCREFVDDRAFVDDQALVDGQAFVDDQAFVDNRAFVDGQTFVDSQTFVDGRAFVNDRAVTCPGQAIASSAGFLRLRRLCPECESVTDGMLTVENPSRDNLIVEGRIFSYYKLSTSVQWEEWVEGLKIPRSCPNRDPRARGHPINAPMVRVVTPLLLKDQWRAAESQKPIRSPCSCYSFCNLSCSSEKLLMFTWAKAHLPLLFNSSPLVVFLSMKMKIWARSKQKMQSALQNRERISS